ncbi:MAG: glycosyltransferase family 2 protein [Candidatus Odinarchaeia archaeon]
MKISVIMPVYNEEKYIKKSVKATKQILEEITPDYEIIIVNDGSTDRTLHKLSEFLDNPRIKLVGYSENKGKGYAIKYGFNFTSGDIILFIDSDMDIPPNQIRRFIHGLKFGDVVIGSKRHPKSKVNASFARKILSFIFYCLVLLFTGVRVRDTQCGLKAFKRKVLQQILPKLVTKKYAFDVEILVASQNLGSKIVELPVQINLNKSFKFKNMVRMFVDLLGITYRYRIMKFHKKLLKDDKLIKLKHIPLPSA